jgi:hypothetical protein
VRYIIEVPGGTPDRHRFSGDALLAMRGQTVRIMGSPGDLTSLGRATVVRAEATPPGTGLRLHLDVDGPGDERRVSEVWGLEPVRPGAIGYLVHRKADMPDVNGNTVVTEATLHEVWATEPLAVPEAPADDALARVRAWVEREVSDWYDPVVPPDLHDDLRLVVGLPPYDRDDGSTT